MAKSQIGICALTGEKCELQESHIYPKFVYKHLKQTGGNSFRAVGNPNKAFQDGFKKPLLGRWAELEFSKRESGLQKTFLLPLLMVNWQKVRLNTMINYTISASLYYGEY